MSDQDSGYNRGDYNKTGLIVFLSSFGFSVMLFIYLGYIHKGVDLKEVSEVIESTEGAKDQPAAKKIDLSTITEPWVYNADLVTHGAKVYKAQCAICHGPKGLGDGAAGKSLNPPPRNLVEGGWKKGGTSKELFITLLDGIEGTSMASFSHLKAIDRWALVHYIRSITKDKPEDDAEALKAYATKGL